MALLGGLPLPDHGLCAHAERATAGRAAGHRVSDTRDQLVADTVTGLVLAAIGGPLLHYLADWPWVWALLLMFAIGFGGCWVIILIDWGDWGDLW